MKDLKANVKKLLAARKTYSVVKCPKCGVQDECFPVDQEDFYTWEPDVTVRFICRNCLRG